MERIAKVLNLRRLPVLVIGLIAGLAFWEYAVVWASIPDYILPAPSQFFNRFFETLPLQVEHLGITATTTLLGLALALILGVLLALLVVYVRPLKLLILPFLAAFNGIPKVAIAPLFVIWFGLGDEPKILLAFLMALFPIFVNAVTGLSEIEPDMINLARLFGGSEFRIFRKVRLIHALPHLTDALKVAFPLALVGSVVGEFIGGNRGVGYLILSAQFNLDTPLVFACLLAITIFTSAGIGFVVLIEELAFAWRPSRRE